MPPDVEEAVTEPISSAASITMPDTPRPFCPSVAPLPYPYVKSPVANHTLKPTPLDQCDRYFNSQIETLTPQKTKQQPRQTNTAGAQ